MGNLRDITLRALDVLGAASVIYCEDTRVTQKLMSAYGLSKRLVRCDAYAEADHAEAFAQQIAQHIAKGELAVLVSDAGTPCISDPGGALIAACVKQGIDVIPISGASALTLALSAAGFVDNTFAFLGFLPPRAAARRQILQEWSKSKVVLVLYEAPQRVKALLVDIERLMGHRHCVIAREITKKFERFYRGTPSELQNLIAQDDHFKGEVVVMIGVAQEAMQNEIQIDIVDLLQKSLQTLSLREAVANVTAQTGLPRKTVYAAALKVQRDTSD